MNGTGLQATELAERMVTIYGMASNLGPIAFERGQPSFLADWQGDRRAVSPEVSAVIDREVQSIFDNAHQAAQAVLRLNRDLLEETAQQLLQQEVLDGEQLQQYLGQAQPLPDLDAWLARGVFAHAPGGV